MEDRRGARANLVPRSSQPSERTSGKIRFDDVNMCKECDLLRAHAFLHAFRNGGLWQAFVVQWRTGKPSRLR